MSRFSIFKMSRIHSSEFASDWFLYDIPAWIRRHGCAMPSGSTIQFDYAFQRIRAVAFQTR